MIYTKPQVEIVKFDSIGFMTSSVGYTSAADALNYACGGYSGQTNNFQCGSFGGYTSPQKGATVTIDGTTYVFTAVGQNNGAHWKCQTV